MNLSFPQRLVFLAGIASVGVALIVLGLFNLQIVDHDVWADALQDRSEFESRVHGMRGRILDADGEVLARDVLGYDLMVATAGRVGVLHECRRCGHAMSIRDGDRFTRCPRCRLSDADQKGPALVPVDERSWNPLAEILGWSAQDLAETVAHYEKRNEERVATGMEGTDKLGERRRRDRERYLQRQYGWQLNRIKADVPYEAAREVALHPYRNPGFEIREGRVRRNVGGAAFASLVGRKPDPAARAAGEASGSGLELVFDSVLSGEPGRVQRVRDKRGSLRIENRVPPIDGVDVQLTIARRDQEAGLAALGSKAGAFVVVNAETGAVLVLASTPSYEPEDFSAMYREATRVKNDVDARRERGERVDLSTVPPDPRLNRAIKGWYAPGSTMKPFTALAGLRFGVITTSDTVECHRQFTLNGKTLSYLRCNGHHGETDLRGALVHSCNVYFQTLMHHLIQAGAEEQFRGLGHAFGFGEATGIEVEAADWLRGATFRLEPRKGRAEYGMRLQHAIGQGYLTATPAQVARAYAGLLTGRLPKLHIVARCGNRVTEPEHQALPVSGAMLDTVREALRATNDPGQSLAREGLGDYEVGCKTGTAQTGYQGLHFAWLAGFGERRGNRPPIAFAMVVEYSALHGGQECGRRVADFLRVFYGEGGRPQ